MQGSRAWLRLRRAWGVVSTGLCGRINQQLRRLQRKENPRPRAGCLSRGVGAAGDRLVAVGKALSPGFCAQESSAGVAEGWTRGGQCFAGLCHISVTPHHTDGTGPWWDGDGEQGCSSGQDQSIPVLPQRICGDSGGPTQLSASPCTSGAFSCSWAPTCSSLPAHGEVRSRKAASCSLKVIWQLLEPGLTAGCQGAALEGRAGLQEGERVAGGQDSHANYCSSSRLKSRALLRLGFFLPL